MNQEFAEFTEAAQQLSEIQEGNTAATNCMIDALIAVLAKAFPPLVESLDQHIDLCSQHYLDNLADAPLATQALNNRIAEVRGLLQSLQ